MVHEPIMLSKKTLKMIGQRGVLVPQYDLARRTAGIVHFGVGSFHRAHQADYLERLAAQGDGLDWAVCGVGLLHSDAAMQEVMRAQDCLYTWVRQTSQGAQTPQVIGAIAEYIHAPGHAETVFERLTAPATRIVSLTVTEQGYHRSLATCDLRYESPEVHHDLEADLNRTEPHTVLGYIVEGLRRRKTAGTRPFTVLSCDNMRGNGDIVRSMVLQYTQQKHPELMDWIAQEVAFPNTMVDRITPGTTQEDINYLRDEWGVHDRWPVISEEFSQWIVEDKFSAGRPALEKVGVQFVDDVEPFELAKLRLLNCSHQILAYLGTLLGYTYVHEAMADKELRGFLRNSYMDGEAAAGIPAIPGLDLEAYKDAVIERFANPYVRDTLSRLIAAQRIPDLLVPLIQENLAAGRSVEVCATVIAAWAVVEGRTERDGLVFLESFETCGNLSDYDAVRTPYTTAVRRIREHGLRALLASWNDPTVIA